MIPNKKDNHDTIQNMVKALNRNKITLLEMPLLRNLDRNFKNKGASNIFENFLNLIGFRFKEIKNNYRKL